MRYSPVLLPEGDFLDSERASELYVDEVLDGSGRFQYLDVPGSVSGLSRVELRLPSCADLKKAPKELLHGSS